MKTSDIFDINSMSVKWDVIWSIPQFIKLQTTPQSKKWHKEGNVSIHTKNVVDMIDKEIPTTDENKEFKMLMMLAALFHDIGKGTTTFFNKEKNDWSSRDHATESDRITRELLYDENFYIRETICYFVRNHMKPLYIIDNPNGTKEIINLSCDIPFESKYCNFKNLLTLKKCDNLGAIFDYDDWIEKLEFAKNLSIELSCFDKPYKFNSVIDKWSYFNMSIDQIPKVSNFLEKPAFTATIKIWDKPIEQRNFKEIVNWTLEKIDKESDFTINVSEIGLENISEFLSLIYVNNGIIKFEYMNEEFENGYISPTLSMINTIN